MLHRDETFNELTFSASDPEAGLILSAAMHRDNTKLHEEIERDIESGVRNAWRNNLDAEARLLDIQQGWAAVAADESSKISPRVANFWANHTFLREMGVDLKCVITSSAAREVTEWSQPKTQAGRAGSSLIGFFEKYYPPRAA